MEEHKHHFVHKLDKSAILTVIGIILLFSTSIAVILVAPTFVDPTWTQPTSSYQVQMYEISDPNLYIGSTLSGSTELQFIYHLKEDFTLLAFHETDVVKIIAPPELEKFITHVDDPTLKLTSHLLMLRPPQENVSGLGFDAIAQSKKKQTEIQGLWEKENPQWREKELIRPGIEILELFEPVGKEAFANAPVDGTIENWVDAHFTILDDEMKQPYHKIEGVIYINNPMEYKVARFTFGNEQGWRYDPAYGQSIKNIQELRSHPLTFRSRAELITLGEHIFAIEGCWYCHTDQTRTLVQDVVLNGSAEYPAPPSSANEYIFQKITFPGTRRIGPDLSRTGIKRPSRDWHKGHFWSPKTASAGSIMPSFKQFFDSDPRGTSKSPIGIPNYRFEAIFQYLMTKGTRITPPTQAWWLGKDPIDTKAIIEGRRKLK
jgi:cytochrome c oxidase cbb3-type subunit 2